MTAHPHAENMRLYAEDAAETDKPWERWQFRWADDEVWGNASDGPMWDVDTQYRRKPKPLECWVYVSDEGMKVGAAYGTKEAAEYYKDQAKGFGWRLAHMREVTE